MWLLFWFLCPLLGSAGEAESGKTPLPLLPFSSPLLSLPAPRQYPCRCQMKDTRATSTARREQFCREAARTHGHLCCPGRSGSTVVAHPAGVQHLQLQICTNWLRGRGLSQLILTGLLNLELKLSPRLLMERRERILASGHFLSVRFLGCVSARVGNNVCAPLRSSSSRSLVCPQCLSVPVAPQHCALCLCVSVAVLQGLARSFTLVKLLLSGQNKNLCSRFAACWYVQLGRWGARVTTQ